MITHNKEISTDIKPSFLELSLSPNPTRSIFTLIAHSVDLAPLHISVFNAEGKNVYQAIGFVEKSYTFGDKLNDGLYTIVVRQGNKIKTIHVVKGR